MRRIIFPLSALILLLCGLISCNVSGVRKYEGIIPGEWKENLTVEYVTGLEKKSVPLRIYFPRKLLTHNCRTLIALHSFKGSPRDWSADTEMTRYADEYNFIIVCPGMGATLYETRYYPETQAKWDTVPGGKWIAEVLVPHLRSRYGAGRDRSGTGILGIGMGARGALLMAAAYPDIFGAAAGLSGYYDNSVLAENRIFISHYGKFAEHRDRWENEDNIPALAENLRDTPVFIAHGLKDKEVPVEHSQLLGINLRHLQKRAAEKYRFEYHEKAGMAHEWRFWKSITPEMMSFFNINLNRE